MTRTFVLALLVGGCAAQLRGQQVDPGYTLRASTNLVILDVVAEDSAGRPIRGLTAADFAVKEDGRPQTLRGFREHSAAQARAAAATVAAPKLAAGLFTNYSAVPSDGPANVLLLDVLNTPLRDQNYAREQIEAYLHRAPAGTRMAIFGLGNTLTILQGFTSDPAILKAALSGKKAAQLSTLLNDPLGGGGGGVAENGVSDALGTLVGSPDVLEAIANAQQFEAETQAVQLKQRAQTTLDSMNELARYLANIPGRKNVIWFSGSFPISIQPNADLDNSFATLYGSEAEFRETMGLLTRSQVALYPVDVRGLTTSGTFNAANGNQKYVRDNQAIGKDLAKFDAQSAAENGTMLEIAQETGGRAFLNTNGLTEAVAKAVDEGANYYTLDYSPANKAADGRYRKLEVTVRGREAVLQYRRGYFADDAKAVAGAAPEADRSVITRSMMRGAPSSTQIQFTARVRRVTAKAEDTVASGNVIVAGNAEAHPPYVRYGVDFAIDPQAFAFRKTPEVFQDAIEFVAFLYDSQGNVVNRAGSTMRANLKPATYADFLRHPLSYSMDISVPAAGNYFLRIAVQDGNSDRVGTIEVPVAAVRELPALDAGGAKTAP